MNYILHGKNSQLSRQKLNEIKGQFDPAKFFQPPLDAPFPSENNLFSTSLGILLEFFRKEDLRKFDVAKFFKDLEFMGFETQIILWFDFELAPSSKILDQARERGFRELKFGVPSLVFKTADAFFAPKKLRRQFYNLMAEFGGNSGSDLFLLQMLVRNCRLFLWASLNNYSFLNLKGFIRRQAEAGKLVRPERLISLYGRLVGLEKRFKGGPLDLASELLVVYEEF